MIGDFDDNANALWSLHLDEAKSHDEARINTLKDDMDGVLIFVRIHIPVIISTTPSSRTVGQAGLFSAALTSFLVDKIQDLQVDPTQQMVYYQKQSVTLLARSPASFPLSHPRSPSHLFFLHHSPISAQTHLMSGSTLSGS